MDDTAPEATPAYRVLAVPEDIFPFAKKQCTKCWGAGKFVVRRAERYTVPVDEKKPWKGSRIGAPEEALCGCAVRQFLRRMPVDLGIGPDLGKMYLTDPDAVMVLRAISPRGEDK